MVDQNSIISFYRAFATNYLMQVARFQHIEEAKRFIGIFNDNFHNESYPELNRITNPRDKANPERRQIINRPLTPSLMKDLLNNRIDMIFVEILQATEAYMVKNTKAFALFNEAGDRIKILPDNEVLFSNLAKMCFVNIIIYSKEYTPYKAFLQNNDRDVCIHLNFEANLYSPREYPNEGGTDNFFSQCTSDEAKRGKSQLLVYPYYGKPEEGNKITLEIARKLEPSIEDQSLNQSLEKFSDVLITNSAYLSEEMRNKLLELIQLDPRFFRLRDKLQSIVDCNHDDYSLFECGQQHCLQCLKDRLVCINSTELHKESCSCGTKYSSKDLQKIDPSASVTRSFK